MNWIMETLFLWSSVQDKSTPVPPLVSAKMRLELAEQASINPREKVAARALVVKRHDFAHST